MLKKLTIVLGMAVAVAGTTTVSSFVFVPEAHAGWYNKAKKATKKVGSIAKSGGKWVGRTAWRGAKGYVRINKRVAKAEVGYIKKVGKAIGRAAKKVAKGSVRITTKGYKEIGNLRPAVHDHRS